MSHEKEATSLGASQIHLPEKLFVQSAHDLRRSSRELPSFPVSFVLSSLHKPLPGTKLSSNPSLIFFRLPLPANGASNPILTISPSFSWKETSLVMTRIDRKGGGGKTLRTIRVPRWKKEKCQHVVVLEEGWIRT